MRLFPKVRRRRRGESSSSPPKKQKLDKLAYLAKIPMGNDGLDTDDEEATVAESYPSTPENDLQVRPVSTDEKKQAVVEGVQRLETSIII